MDSKVFGQFIARIRREKNMTQADLAGKIGVTDKAVSRWERGVGFPDINMLEPLAGALELSVLELMRSERSEMDNENNGLSGSEVTEIMESAVRMAKEIRRQDKTSLWIAGIVTIAAAALAKLFGHANVGGSVFCGAMAALAAVGSYLFIRNREDKESRKVYGFFMLAGIGICIGLLYFMGVDPSVLIWGVYGIFCLVTGLLGR